LHFVATDAKPYAMVPQRMLPHGTVYANAKDLHKMRFGNYPDSNEEMMRFAKEIAKEWNKDFNHVPFPFYITLGPHGVYVGAKSDGIFHSHLEKDKAREIDKLTVEMTGRTTGMGDATAGAITLISSVIHGIAHPTSIAKLGQTAAVKSILGYQGEMTDRTYVTHKIN
jgi:hypothetical protein